MPNFTYKVRDSEGKIISGVMEASNLRSVIEKLRGQGYFIASVEEEKPAAPSLLSFELTDLFVRIKAQDLMVFNNQLATMISSGLTLTSSLNTIQEQIVNRKLRAVIQQVAEDVEGGNSFSGALEKHPKVFTPLFVSMIHAGETGGALEEVLQRLATFAEKEEHLRSSVMTALTYPVLIIFVAVGVVSFLVVKIFPVFEKIFKSSGAALPMPTQILLATSSFLRTQWYLLAGAVVLIILGIYGYSRTETGRYNLDFMKLKIPVIGLLLRKVAISRFSRTLATLLNSGVPIIQSLRIVQGTIGNRVVATTLNKVIDSVNRGESMAEPLRGDKVFPPMVSQMVAVGEEAGTVDDVLNKTADFYDEEVDHLVRRLSSLIEPVLIIFIGGMVLFIALALFLPMFGMIGVIR